MFLRTFLFGALVMSLTGCGTIPEFTGSRTEAARNMPYPDLVPLATLINTAQSDASRITPASISTTNNRIARLRTNANALRGPVVDQATHSEMQNASARAALR